MKAESAWRELGEQLRGLAAVLDNLSWAVYQGQPGDKKQRPPILVDDCEANAADLCGLVAEAQAAIQHATEARGEADLASRRQALAECHSCYNRLWWRFYSESPFTRRRSAFHGLRRGGGEWAGWVAGVDDALQQFGSRFLDTGQALAVCWEALVETAASAQVSITANTIGQEFHFQPRRAETGRNAEAR